MHVSVTVNEPTFVCGSYTKDHKNQFPATNYEEIVLTGKSIFSTSFPDVQTRNCVIVVGVPFYLP